MTTIRGDGLLEHVGDVDVYGGLAVGKRLIDVYMCIYIYIYIYVHVYMYIACG
jgi:hypothetical protein